MAHVPYKTLVVAIKAALYGGGWHFVLAHRIGEPGIAQGDRNWLAGG